MSTPGIEKLAELAYAYNDEKYRLEVRVIELEQRIRELEAENQRLRMDQLHFVTPFEARIAKARKILKVIGLFSELSWAREKAKEALEALEGK